VARALAAAAAEVEEATRGVGRYLAGLEADPGRLQAVEDRLDALRRLCRKHGVAPEGLGALKAELEGQLSLLDNRAERLEALGHEREAAAQRARKLAEKLSEQRRGGAARLEKAVREGLSLLALPGAGFEVRLSALTELSPHGIDEIEFYFGPNVGEPLRPLAKVASGGEASRVLLAFKRALAAQDGCGAYVLDEADAGIGGAVAEVVGRMIKEVSVHRQVLCVTHHPQVAAYADVHLRVEKSNRRDRTVSRVVTLEDGAMRAQELARMLAGVEVTREALGAAEALLRSARGATSGRAKRAESRAVKEPGRPRARAIA
jgi:DNA repair protein RecN (Recombination protein N)